MADLNDIADRLAARDTPTDSGGDNPKSVFIKRMQPLAEEVSKKTGLPPDLIIGQWGHESAWGTSRAARQNNNFAGIKPWKGRSAGSDTNYAGYGSPEDFAQGYADFLNENPRYSNTLAMAKSGADMPIVARSLSNAGYAEDPEYARRLIDTTNRIRPMLSGDVSAVPANVTLGTPPASTEDSQPGAEEGSVPLRDPDGRIHVLTAADLDRLSSGGGVASTAPQVSDEEWAAKYRAANPEASIPAPLAKVSVPTGDAPSKSIREAASTSPYFGNLFKPQTSEATGEGIVGQPLPGKRRPYIGGTTPETPTMQEGTGTGFISEAGRVLRTIAQGPIAAIEKTTGIPFGVTREGSLGDEEQARLKELGLPTEPVPGFVSEQKQATKLNPDNPDEAAQLADLRQKINRGAGNVASAESIAGPQAAEQMRASGNEPQTGIGQTIASAGQGATEFMTEAAIAKGLHIPDVTGLNTFGSAALLGVARPVAAGEEPLLRGAIDIEGGEVLGNILKIPNVVNRVVSGAAFTTAQSALQVAAGGHPLNPKDLVTQAAQGAFMTLGGEHGEEAAHTTPEVSQTVGAEEVEAKPSVLHAESSPTKVPEEPSDISTPKQGDVIKVAGGHIDVTVHAPKGEPFDLPRESRDIGTPETYTPDHTIGTINDIGQTVDRPMVALVGDEQVGRKVFVADLYDEGKFAGHNVIANVGTADRAYDMLESNYGKDVSDASTVHEIRQGALKDFLTNGDLDKPFGDQREVQPVSYTRTVAKEETAPKSETESTQPTEKGAEDDAVSSGEQAVNDQPEHPRDDAVVGKDGNDRQPENSGPKESPRSSSGGGDEQGKGSEPVAEPISEEKPIGLAHSVMDEARDEAGLISRAKYEGHSDEELIDKAKQIVSDNPTEGWDMVESVNSGKKKSTSDVDQMVILHEATRRGDIFDRATEAYNEAESDEDRASTAAAMNEAHDKYQQAIEAADKAGSTTGAALRARRLLLEKDFTLRAMVSRAKAFNGVKELPPELMEDVQRAHADIASKEQAVSDAEEARRDAMAEMHVKAMIDDLRGRGKKSADIIDSEIKSARKSKTSLGDLGKKWIDEGNDLLGRAAGRLHAGIDSEDVVGLVKWMAGHLLNGAANVGEMLKGVADDIRAKMEPRLTGLLDHAKALAEEVRNGYGSGEKVKAEMPTRTTAEILGDDNPREPLNGHLVYELARKHAEDGITDHRELFDAVLNDLKSTRPDITIKDVRDAYSGYGKARTPSKDELARQLGEAKTWARLISSIEDAEGGRTPSRTGMQRRKPTADIRKMMSDLRQKMRDAGITTVDTERQLHTSLEAVHTRLKNSIEDVKREIETGERKARSPGVEYDDEAKALRAQLDDLQKQRDDIFGKQGISDERRVKVAMAAAERSTNEYQRRIDEKDVGPRAKGPEAPVTEELRAMRDARDAKRKEFEDLRDAINPPKTELDRYKESVDKRVTELRRREQEKDHTKPTKKLLELDAEAQQKKILLTQARRFYQASEKEWQRGQRHWAAKGIDRYTDFQRGGKLSGLGILGKLSTAGVSRQFVVTPVEEGVTSGIKRIPLLSQVAQRAPREGGGFSPEAERIANVAYFHEGMQDAFRHLQGQSSDLDYELGGSDDLLKQGWMSLPGHIHAALKAPTKRAEFERALYKREQFATNQGRDITQPEVADELRRAAFKDAKRAIFMQDNMVASWFSGGVNRLLTSKTNVVASRSMGAFLQTIMPFVKVSSNVVAEANTYATGLATGTARLLYAVHKGIDNLGPDQADAIMRNFKKGSIGAGLILVGYHQAQNIGGFYQAGKKLQEGDVEPEKFRVMGVDLPAFMAHTPPAMMLQLGATIARMQQEYMVKHGGLDDSRNGLLAGAAEGYAKLITHVPFADAINRLSSPIETGDWSGYAGGVIGGVVVPGGLGNIAKGMDAQKPGVLHGISAGLGLENPTPRATSGFEGQVLSNIPGLRQTLPEKQEKISDLFRRGDVSTGMALAKAKGMDPAAVRRLFKKSQVNSSLEQFEGMKNTNQMVNKFELATPEQRAMYQGVPDENGTLPILKKIANTSTLTPQEKQEQIKRVIPLLVPPAAAEQMRKNVPVWPFK